MNISTLAIRPFFSMSAGPGNPYFEDGVTVPIIHFPAKIEETWIISGVAASMYMHEEYYLGSVTHISQPLPLTIPFPLFKISFKSNVKIMK